MSEIDMNIAKTLGIDVTPEETAIVPIKTIPTDGEYVVSMQTKTIKKFASILSVLLKNHKRQLRESLNLHRKVNSLGHMKL